MAASTKRRVKKSVYDEQAAGDHQDQGPVKDTGPKVKAVFVSGPLRLRRRVPTRHDLFGRGCDQVNTEDDQAATQWDADLWRPV